MLFIVKVGTNTICDQNGILDLEIMVSIAKQIKKLLKIGHSVVLISSGAIGSGMQSLGLEKRPEDLTQKQVCAALGQPILMQTWQLCFQEQKVSQHLVSSSVFQHPENLQNFKNCLNGAIEMKLLPIINENDAVSTAEIDTIFTDNDSLAVEVALSLSANYLLILSDIDGLFDKNPKENPDAKIISNISVIDEQILSLASGKSNLGTGGMRAKLLAIQKAMLGEVSVFLTNGKKVNSILQLSQLFEGENPKENSKENIQQNIQENIQKNLANSNLLGTLFAPEKGEVKNAQ